ncbi:MAG: hypothetical protein H0V45_06975 [Actinobacteria bacterium]|nr:hypothetical protein [Actinomycetota bacterium]
MIDHPSLLSEIRSLLDTPAGAAPLDRDAVEHTLTNGYAHALHLEGERLRIEDRLRSAVRSDGGGREANDELTDLTVELARADQELARLRSLLSTLRTHALT